MTSSTNWRNDSRGFDTDRFRSLKTNKNINKRQNNSELNDTLKKMINKINKLKTKIGEKTSKKSSKKKVIYVYPYSDSMKLYLMILCYIDFYVSNYNFL